MSRRAKLAACFVASAMLVGLAGCTGSDGAGIRVEEDQGFIDGDGTSDIVEPDDRESVPDVSGVTLQGDELSLSDFAGDVVVVNVWGSWCGPCREEARALQEVYDKNSKRGVQFVGLNTRDQQAAALAFEDGFGISYPSLVDQSGELQLAFRDTLPPNAIPSTIVIDREGRVAARVLGPTTYSQLSDLVDHVASES